VPHVRRHFVGSDELGGAASGHRAICAQPRAALKYGSRRRDAEHGLPSDDGVLVTETMIIEALPAAEAAAGPSGGGEPLSVKASLVAMGFTDPTMVDAVLAKNGDDLEACAADLAAASEWDSLLDDLHEMGFANRELNKTLMLKNGGNIKRTVKDLVEA